MPSQYNGQGGNLVAPSTVNISSSTNANPSVVQTATAHNLTSGDIVDIQGHQVNTAINGQRIVTVVDTTHFIVPVAANGAGGATGTVTPLTMGQTFQIPSAGDRRAAASVNVGFQALADRTVALGVWTGAYKLTQLPVTAVADANILGVTTSQWTVSVVSLATWTNASAKIATISGVQSTDILELDFRGSWLWTANNTAALSLAYVAYAPGASPGALTRVGGSGVLATSPTAGTNTWVQPLALGGCIQNPGVNGNVDVWFQGALTTTTTGTITIYKESTFTVRVWRPTTMPQ